MSGEIAQILRELASGIETTYAQLNRIDTLPKVIENPAPNSSSHDVAGIEETLGADPGSTQPVMGLPHEVVAIAQDLRETANAALQSRPTLFWIESLLGRVRTLGLAELGSLVAGAEQEISRHYR